MSIRGSDTTITDDQLRELFARHCECRPLDLTRSADDHAAIHDCDTGILHDVQVALGIVLFDDIGRVQAMREARSRCAGHLALVPNDRGGYAKRTPVTLADIAQKIYEERYVDPKDPETAAYMRDGMIREVAQRTLELTIGSVSADVIVELVTSRRDRNAAHETVVAWMKEAGDRGELVQASQSPDWSTYRRAEEAWHDAVAKLDTVFTKEPGQ